MTRSTHERAARDGWSLWLDPSAWRDDWWAALLAVFENGGAPFASSRHARTWTLALPGEGAAVRAFVKLYEPRERLDAVKDLWRPSRAVHALRASTALAAEGFLVPRVLAAGEERRLRRLGRAFLLTEEVALPTLIALAEDVSRRAMPAARAIRRLLAARLGDEVGRLHRQGWVHGDLLATNLLVGEGDAARCCYIDHDRTRRVAPPRREPLQRRNLVQLNRLPLAGVTHGDRMRFFRHYAAQLEWSPERTGREARRLAEATRRRRIEIERLAGRKAERATL